MTVVHGVRRATGGDVSAREMGNETLQWSARLGLSARALIYLLIGFLAVLVAAGHSTKETDQWGAFQQLNRGTFGHIVLWVLAVGLAGYSLWRFSEAALGAAGEGHKVGPRLKSFFRGCIYGFFAVSAFQVALGDRTTSQAQRQQSLTAKVMQHPGGRWAVGLVGAISRGRRAGTGLRRPDTEVREVPAYLGHVTSYPTHSDGARHLRHHGSRRGLRLGRSVRHTGRHRVQAVEGGRPGRRPAVAAGRTGRSLVVGLRRGGARSLRHLRPGGGPLAGDLTSGPVRVGRGCDPSSPGRRGRRRPGTAVPPTAGAGAAAFPGCEGPVGLGGEGPSDRRGASPAASRRWP